MSKTAIPALSSMQGLQPAARKEFIPEAAENAWLGATIASNSVLFPSSVFFFLFPS
jgi:hypothetical protein